jgi:HAD superfamily hydrolase (TIGR01548 family)
MDLLIFDMDGVLIDVSKSYRETIRQTVHIYLETCLGFQMGKKGPISEEDITLFKSISGFNNDWDLTSGLLLYLLSISSLPPFKKKKRFPSIEEIVSYLREKSSGFLQKNTIQLNGRPRIPSTGRGFSRKKNFCTLYPRPQDRTFWVRGKHTTSFIKEVKVLGGGLKGVLRTSAGSWDGWVYRSGELNKENLVKRIFQEVYLGNQFFFHYHLPPLFYRGKGLYQREKLLITKEVLSSLRKKIRMGIASGRPRFEAELALKRFRLLPYFNSVVTLDECMEEEARILRSTGRRMRFSKPHPYSLLRVIQEIGIPNPQCGYVGDVVDDMLAARAVKNKLQIVAIGFLSGHSKLKAFKESLFRAGADLVIENPKDLLRLID